MTTQSITSEPRTEPQTKQLKRLMEDTKDLVLAEVDLGKEPSQRLIERGGEFQAYIVTGFKCFSAKLTDYTLAQTILGKDFITPEEVSKSRGLTYNEDQLTKFGDTLPSQEVLVWCRDNGYMVVAGPNKPMSLLEVREMKSEYLSLKTGGWHTNQKFVRHDKADTRWIMVRKEPVPKSTSKTWNEQQALFSDVEVTPNVAEVVWVITTYKAVRGIYLLPSIYMRTSSFDSDGYRVNVGAFDAEGLGIGYWYDELRTSSLGVSSARK